MASHKLYVSSLFDPQRTAVFGRDQFCPKRFDMFRGDLCFFAARKINRKRIAGFADVRDLADLKADIADCNEHRKSPDP